MRGSAILGVFGERKEVSIGQKELLALFSELAEEALLGHATLPSHESVLAPRSNSPICFDASSQ